MKHKPRIMAAFLVISCLPGVIAYASPDPGASGEAELTPSSYGTLTYWKSDEVRDHRDDTGFIRIGYAVEDGVLNGSESNWSDGVTLQDGGMSIALTETIHGTEYTSEAMDALNNKYPEIEYELMDENFQITENEADAAYIHFTKFYTQDYFCLGQVLNHLWYNGESTLDVVVEDGSVWNVTGESLVTSLSGNGTINGVVRDNGDGTFSVFPAAGWEG
ncbi:MAG: hypothetical protein ACI3W7_06690 [Oscillospiraceae bacterium]